jgi:hypothetical protein
MVKTYPDITAHTIRAKYARRLVRLAPIDIEPGEVAPVNLPYAGLRASDFLAAVLACKEEDGEALSGRVNRTGAPIRIWHGFWADTGGNAGYFWSEHLEFEEI